MTSSTHPPDASAIHALYAPGLKSQAVRVALLLGLFSALADGPLDAVAVARARECSSQGTRVLLDCLVAAGLLSLAEARYELTPTAAAFLVPGEAAYAGDWVLAETDPRFWEGVLDSVRTGEPAEARFPWSQDAWLESYRSDRREQALAMWRAAGIDSNGDAPIALLDLACGCGVKSMVLAQSRPGVHVTCVDSAEVLDVARHLASRLGISDRVSFESGDVLEADLSHRSYDAALLGQITDYFTAAQNTELFTRLRAALRPEGVLVIDVPMSSDHPGEGASMVSLLTWSLSGGRAHSFSDYEEWLAQAGFGSAERLGKTWVAARA